MKRELIEINRDTQGQQLRNQSMSVPNDQWLREFVKNSIEATQEYQKGYSEDNNYKPEVQIRNHSGFKDLSNLEKISIIDNGIGMKPEDMVSYTRLLGKSSDYKENKEEEKNYGVGAKISAVTRNPCGIYYESWEKGKKGYSLTIDMDEENDGYGVKPIILDGERKLFEAIDDDVMPDLIRKYGHGTRVTLWGKTEDEDTTKMGSHGIKAGTDDGRWRSKILNKRFYDFPEGLSIKNQRNYMEKNRNDLHLIKVKPLRDTLENSFLKKGTVKLSSADIEWWILHKNRKDSPNYKVDSHTEFLTGHTAIVYENEVFGITFGKGNMARDFGIPTGQQDIVLHIRPHQGKGYHQDYTRREIQHNGNQLDYSYWQNEFIDNENFPKEIKDYIESLIDKTPRSEKVDKLLNEYKKYFVLPKYKISENGNFGADEDNLVFGFSGKIHEGEKEIVHDQKPNPGILEDYKSLVRVKDKKNANKINDPFPPLEWIPDDGSIISKEELSDRAAVYQESYNKIFANKNFKGFEQLVEVFIKMYKQIQVDPTKINEIVRSAFEMRLKESIAGAMTLKNRMHWSGDDIKSAISPETLTVCVSAKIQMMQQIKGDIDEFIKKSRKKSLGNK